MAQTTQQLQKDDRYSKRTQISLSPRLHRIVTRKTALNKESMSEYIRKAIEIRIKNEKSEDTERIKTINAFIGAGKEKNYPEWSSKKSVIKWQREMREDPPRLS